MELLTVEGNPALQDYKSATEKLNDYTRMLSAAGLWPDLVNDRRRNGFNYAWAVPTEEIIKKIAEFTEAVVEIGAGTGYWAAILSEAGIDVKAYDLSISDESIRQTTPGIYFFDVEDGGVEKAGKFPDRALFLCWPPGEATDGSVAEDDAPVIASKMAEDSLRAYLEAGGTSLIYIGELPRTNGTTLNANRDFFSLIADNFDEVEDVPMRNWPGERGVVRFYTRKSRS